MNQAEIVGPEIQRYRRILARGCILHVLDVAEKEYIGSQLKLWEARKVLAHKKQQLEQFLARLGIEILGE